jgi:hypothetical protein
MEPKVHKQTMKNRAATQRRYNFFSLYIYDAEIFGLFSMSYIIFSVY